MIKIGLDAGHGLKTSGKQTPNGIKEWVLNDAVRDKVVAYLKPYGVDIVNVDNDEGNVDESLNSRLNTYLAAGVVLFVSLHHNALDGRWGKQTGVEVWVDKNATEKDMALANAIYKRLPSYTGLKGRGIKKQNWYVINQNQIPAALIEGGFMDSEIDYPVITSEQGKDAYARAVAEGIVEYLGLTKQETAAPAPAAPSNIKAHVTVTANTLNIRSGSGTNYKIVSQAKKGGEYDVFEIQGDWGKINGGWFNLKYTTYFNNITPAPAPAAKAKEYKVKINTAVLNVRAGAGTKYKINTTVKQNEVYTIVEEKNDWGNLKSGAGWINLDYTKRI